MNEVEVTQELIPSKTINVPDLFTNKDVARILVQSIRQKALDFVPDISTAKGRKEIASQAYKVAQSKTFLDGLRKDYVSDLKAKTKSVDEIGKFIRDECDLIKKDTRKELDDWEASENARIAAEEAERQYLSDWDDAITENDLVDRQREIERREAELVRIEAERKAKEEAERLERERKEREDRIAKDAAEKAKREAEFKAKAEQERIEREKREAERKARNKAHQAKINREVLACFVENGFEEATAKNIIQLIYTGKISHVTINY